LVDADVDDVVGINEGADVVIERGVVECGMVGAKV